MTSDPRNPLPPNPRRRAFLLKTLGCFTAIRGAVACPLPADSTQPPERKTGLVYSDVFLGHNMGPGHPESPQRLLRVMQRLRSGGMMDCVDLAKPALKPDDAILLVHTTEHVRGINERHPHALPTAMNAVSAGLTAVDGVCTGRWRNAFCAVRPPGHHARNTGREEGFCFFNSIAVAARFAQRRFGVQRVLIVDWDYHHGDGTEEIFYDDASVLYFSTHDLEAYPGTGSAERIGAGAKQGLNINVPLRCGATDADIIKAFESRLIPAADAFRPELVLISAGFDSRIDDTLGCFAVTDDGYRRLTRIVMNIADRHGGGRVVSMLEGGYNLDGLASAVETHVATLAGRNPIR
jgi:acetoin utilization deacetylase AcuC-like enzyme